MFSFYYNKNNYLSMNDKMKKYIKDNNNKIFSNHYLRYNNKMKLISIDGDDNVNKNDYFFYDLSDIEDNIDQNKKSIEKKDDDIIDNDYDNEIINSKNKVVYLLGSSSILMVISFFISYKYYLQIRQF
jgi:hypothetical protein